jgi:hypothetical protein
VAERVVRPKTCMAVQVRNASDPQWRQSSKSFRHNPTKRVLGLKTGCLHTKASPIFHNTIAPFSTSPAFSAPSGCAPPPPALAPHGPAAAPVRPPPLLTPMPLAHRCCAACSKSSPLMKPDCTSSAQKPILALRKSAWPARACGRAYTVRPCSRLWRGQRARYRPPP